MEHSGPVQTCNGIALSFTSTLYIYESPCLFSGKILVLNRKYRTHMHKGKY